jgi:amino acid transporter
MVLAITGTVQELAGTTSTLLLLVFASVHVGLLVVKSREPRYEGFQVPRAVPALGLVTCLSLAAFAQGLSMNVAAAILTLGLGLVVWQRGWGPKTPRDTNS